MKRQVVRDGLTREEFTEERVQALAAELKREFGAPILSFEARERSRLATLARLPEGEALWVFGYGSLMWNPGMIFEEARPALLHGYHRRFCLWMLAGRGTPEHPGLMVGLRPGGRCRGMAFRIAPDRVEEETRLVWRREMLVSSYIPRWVRLATAAGTVDAITFVVDRKHPRFAGPLAEETVVRSIATATGRLGRCRDYLNNLVCHLDELGLADGPMHRLLDQVEAHTGEPRPDTD